MRKIVLALVFLICLSGCQNKITEYVDKQFPPVSEEQQRTAAIDGAARSLSHIHTSSIGVGVNLEDLNGLALPAQLRQQGVKSVKLSGERQLLKVAIEFERTFTAQDAADNADVARLLDLAQPHVKGELIVYGGLTSEVVDTPAGSVLQLKLLPSLSSVKVDQIDLKGNLDLSAVGTAIVAQLNKYKDNVSGELSRSAMTTVSVPMLSTAPLDLNHTMKIDSGGTQGTLVASAAPVGIPYQLSGIAWLVGENGITVLVQLLPTAAPAHEEVPQAAHTYDSLSAAFQTHLQQDFGLQESKGNWVAVRKDVTAHALNTVIGQAALCFAPTVSVAKQHMANEIKLPNGLGIDCSPTKVCGERQCTFEKHADDTRDCNQCFAYAPKICVGSSIFGPGGCTGGQCIQRWNEPTCELAKATQNQIYLAEANLNKADCDRIAAQEKIACEAEKTGTKALCEVKKEALNALARTGKFANLDVDVSVQTKELKVCITDFNLSPQLDHVKFALDVHGSAEASTDVKFVPLDIVGHLACVMDWNKQQTFAASLRDARVGIAADVALAAQPDGFFANAAVKDVAFKARLSPGPTEYLLKSPELLVKCPVLAAVAPTVLTLTPFVPVLKGEIDYTLPEQKLSMKLVVPEQKLGDKVLTITLAANPAALVVKGTVSK